MIWELEIENIRRVGPIEIGIDKAQVHELLGSPSRSFRRTQDVQEPSDHYEKDGVFVYYRSDGKVEAVEIASPREARIDGVDLLSMTLDDAKQYLQRLDRETVLEADGAISRKTGIAIYGSCGPSERIESAIVFEDGYYD